MRLAAILLAGVLVATAAGDEEERPYAGTPCPVLVERIGEWIERLADATPSERDAIVARLVRVGEPGWPRIAAALDHPSYEVQEGAIRALGACGHPEAVEILAAVAGDRRRVLNLRVLALDSLGQEGSAAAAGHLVAHALGEEAELRAPAARALARVRSPAGIDGLLRIARERRELRDVALEGLSARTGQTGIGGSLERWERWWKVNRYTMFESGDEDR